MTVVARKIIYNTGTGNKAKSRAIKVSTFENSYRIDDLCFPSGKFIPYRIIDLLLCAAELFRQVLKTNLFQ